ncbi:MAG: hypothetical protein JSS02_18160 [Planctomycetes bacterium]|nr:hypothetical protein [Planctomycetota bacterium]
MFDPALQILADVRDTELRELQNLIHESSTSPETAFVFPSRERQHREQVARRARRMLLFRRALVTLSFASGALIGNTSVGIATGTPWAVLIQQATRILLYGVVGTPVFLQVLRYLAIMHLARSEEFQADPHNGLAKLLISPWPTFRFLIWALPALFAGWNLSADTWSWTHFGFAAVGSLVAGVVALALFQPESSARPDAADRP